jgi:Rps23 Pro-64 3,4-dihydroxylase Tpa1-like proline 4-hydroxylase
MIKKENFRLGEENYSQYLTSSDNVKAHLEKYNTILTDLDLNVGDEVYILTFINHMMMPGVVTTYVEQRWYANENHLTLGHTEDLPHLEVEWQRVGGISHVRTYVPLNLNCINVPNYYNILNVSGTYGAPRRIFGVYTSKEKLKEGLEVHRKYVNDHKFNKAFSAMSSLSKDDQKKIIESLK